MERFPGFIGPSYTLRAINLDCQNCVNFYPELDELQTGKEREIGALIGRPGLKLFGTYGTGPGRGVYTASNGGLVLASGNQLFQINSDKTSSVIGTLRSTSGMVSVADNGVQMMTVDGLAGYINQLGATGNLQQITNPNFKNGGRVSFQDGYFITPIPGTQQFQWSGLYDGTAWDPLDFASSEGSPDNLVTCLSDHREVWLFGSMSTEIFSNTGSTSTFERIQGAFIEYGCAAPFTPQKLNNSVIWLSTGPNGGGIVMKASGYQPVRVSNYAIESALQGYGDLSGAYAWTYSYNGHHFYCLQVPAATTTWVYDDTVGIWHEMTYMDSVLGQQRHLASSHAFAYNQHFVCDSRNGNLYTLDPNTYTDNGRPIVGIRTAPYIASNMLRIIHDALQIDMETGIGLDGIQQGTDPQLMLMWSDDYGKSWSSEHWMSMGPIGQNHARVLFRRLGVSRARIYRVKITDPVRRNLVGAELLLRVGRS
jgi:hypothetical protein